MKVVSYKNVVPVKNKSQEKADLLTKYIAGVTATGDQGIYHSTNDLLDCDVAVIQGWQHEIGKSAPHLRLRQKIIDTQIAKKKFVCVADSNLFLYATLTNSPHHYLRYSFNGVFPNTGIYFDSTPNPKRWQQISTDLKINLQSNVRNGSSIVLCVQRNGGWSMSKTSTIDWINNTVTKIRQHSDRPIVVRPHPKDNKAQTDLRNLNLTRFKNVSLSLNKALDQDLIGAWAVVNHNSSSIVAPVIKGYHAFITDPLRSQCREVAHTDFSKIESPDTFDRQSWLERISMFHWKFSELEDGSAWQHMRQFCQ
jgi:hypothetical protein